MLLSSLSTVITLALSVLRCQAVSDQTGSEDVKQSAAQLLQASDFQKAISVIESALKQSPSDPELWNLEGIAQGELKRPQASQQAFEHGLRLAPQSVSLNENLGFLFYRQGDYQRAKPHLNRAKALGSSKPGVLFSLAACKLRTGEIDAAITELKELEPALGNASEYWDERGRAELARDPAGAEISFKRAIELTPADLMALNGAATAAERQGLDEKALSYLIEAKKTAPSDITTLAHFASVCIRRDLGVDAKEAAQKAHELAPENNTALYLLARADISLQNWNEALNGFTELSKRAPRFSAAYFAMGWLNRKLDRPGDARKQIEYCLRLDPHLADAQYELAELEREEGNENRAEELLRALLRQTPDHVKGSVALADILLRQGKLEDAELLLKSAAGYSPQSAETHYKLSLLYSRRHQNELAEKERGLATSLEAEVSRSRKTQLRLVLPEANAIK